MELWKSLYKIKTEHLLASIFMLSQLVLVYWFAFDEFLIIWQEITHFENIISNILLLLGALFMFIFLFILFTFGIKK